MSRTFRPWTPSQSYLFPPSPQEWLPDGHLVYFLLDLVDSLDLSEIESAYAGRDGRGARGYDPRMMTLLLLYSYARGIPSSRRIERATYEDVAFRVLTGDQHPDHTRIAEFRRQHLAGLGGLFLETLRLAQAAGLAKLGHVALDGTKMKANASKHKAMSYERMLKKVDELQEEVDGWLDQAEVTDQSEDECFGKGRRDDEVPEELRRRKDRLARIKEAKAKLEAEAAVARARQLAERAQTAETKAEQADDGDGGKARRAAEQARAKAAEAVRDAEEKADDADDPPPDLRTRDRAEPPRHQVPFDKHGSPTPKAQRNFTDPDSRIMKDKAGYVQGYNAQVIADSESQIIVAQDVTNQSPDSQHFIPLVEQMRTNCGADPWRLSADAGYSSAENIEYCNEKGLDAYIAPGRLKHGEKPPPAVGRIPKDLDAKGRMRRKLATSKGRKTYARRKVIVEPVFGQIKQAQGIRGFLLRGLDKVRHEWALICASHNLLKLHRAAAA